MSIGKTLAFSLLSSGGVFRLGRALCRRSLIVLTYHRVIAKTPYDTRPSSSVFSCEFEEQIEYLVRRYHIAKGEEVRSLICEGGSLPSNSVLITFDDGYENNYTRAFPVLQRYGATATFFLTTGLIGRAQASLWFDDLDSLLSTNSIRPVIERLKALGLPAGVENERGVRKWIKGLSRQPRENAIETLKKCLGYAYPTNTAEITDLMTWEQIREMSNAGMTFGSHTDSHQILASGTPEEMEHELLHSRLKIESETGRPCWAFAYPNGESGDFDGSHKVALKAAGYACAFTQIPGFVDASTEHYALPRIPIPDSGDIRVFASRVSGVHQWWQNRISSSEQQPQPRY